MLEQAYARHTGRYDGGRLRYDAAAEMRRYRQLRTRKRMPDAAVLTS